MKNQSAATEKSFFEKKKLILHQIIEKNLTAPFSVSIVPDFVS